MQTNFISKYQELKVWGRDEKLKPIRLASFTPIGNKMGGFSTDDTELVEALKNHPDHGKGFHVIKDKMPHFENEHIIKGAVTSIKAQEFEAQKKNLEEENKLELAKMKAEQSKKYIRFGELTAKLLKNDGSYRADATDELKAEYEQLKKEIGD